MVTENQKKVEAVIAKIERKECAFMPHGGGLSRECSNIGAVVWTWPPDFEPFTICYPCYLEVKKEPKDSKFYSLSGEELL